jgi:hypothetical protein
MKLLIIKFYPLIFSLVGKNIFLSTIFSNNIRPCSSVLCHFDDILAYTATKPNLNFANYVAVALLSDPDLQRYFTI